jgi:hypothetical protein
MIQSLLLATTSLIASSVPRSEKNGSITLDSLLSASELDTLCDSTTGRPLKFLTLAVLVRCLEWLESQEAETNVFLGTRCNDYLQPLSISEASAEMLKYQNSVIFIDEVPMKGATDFISVLFLRNIIRSVGGLCILSGTESSLINMVDTAQGSRHTVLRPWVGLLTRLPRTKLAVFNHHGKLDAYEKYLLEQARPFFVEGYLALRATLEEDVSCEHSRRLSRHVNETLTPSLLTRLKIWTHEQKPFLLSEMGLHGQLALIFTASLNSTDVATAVDSLAFSVAQVSSHDSTSAKSSRTISSLFTMDHSLLIRHHRAYLKSPFQQIEDDCDRFIVFRTLYHHNRQLKVGENVFKPKACYKRCSSDELLNLVCLRGGLLQISESAITTVPTSYAFRSFRTNTSFRNGQEAINNGRNFEEECLAAAVLGSHRYETFLGTPLLNWLEFFVAELSPEKEFRVVSITAVPDRLMKILENGYVGLLSPVDSAWSMQTSHRMVVSTLKWCKNADEKDASFRSTIGNVTLEMKDRTQFGGQQMASVTRKFSADETASMCFLVSSNIANFQEATLDTFSDDVEVYLMNNASTVTLIRAGKEKKTKPMIAIDLSRLYPDRQMLVQHSR